MTVSTETVLMAKSRPRKNQSERSDLPCHIISENYYMARKIRVFCLVLSWSGFCHADRFRGNGHKLRIILLTKAGKFKTSMARVPYNKLFTKLASSSRTAKYWPSVVFVQTSLRSVRTDTTSGMIVLSTALALG